jgi:hypothetical protein
MIILKKDDEKKNNNKIYIYCERCKTLPPHQEAAYEDIVLQMSFYIQELTTS